MGKKKPPKIHFVCEGNTFRSRLAEAYLKSLKTKGEVSSSGVDAKRNLNGPITPWANEVAKKEGIYRYLAKMWTQSTKRIIDPQDLVIFLEKKYFDFCNNRLRCELQEYEIWDIPDITLVQKEITDARTKRALNIFQDIKSNVDSLKDKYQL